MILVFKTNVTSKAKAKKLAPHLNKSLSGAKWNFDLTDRDKILRIDCEKDVSKNVINTLQKYDYNCIMLE